MTLKMYFAVEQIQHQSDSANVDTQKIKHQGLCNCRFEQQLKSSLGEFGKVKREVPTYLLRPGSETLKYQAEKVL